MNKLHNYSYSKLLIRLNKSHRCLIFLNGIFHEFRKFNGQEGDKDTSSNLLSENNQNNSNPGGYDAITISNLDISRVENSDG